MTRRATVLVPAHNESSVIARTLRPLCAMIATGQVSLIVIANGCSDDTAQAVAAACPLATVLQSPVASKTQALNLGMTAADPSLPVLCLDGDLQVSAAGLLALISAIEAGAAAAVGQMRVDASAASSLVQAYQRAWTLNPYFANGKFGGVFALAPEMTRNLFPLPQVTGDDEYLRRSIDPQRVAFVPECQFTAQSPRSLASLLATRRRALRGARQVGRLGLADPATKSAWHMLRASLAAPHRLLDLLVFSAVGLAARLSLAVESPTRPATWERDLTTRNSGVAS